MSVFSESSDCAPADEDVPYVPSESIEDMEARHEREKRSLDEKIQAMLKGVKKANRIAIETQAIQMGYDLKAKQSEELETLECYIEKHGDFSISFRCKSAEVGIEKDESHDQESDKIKTKKAKAQRKKDRKATKETEREAHQDEIRASAGPNLREIELQHLNRILACESFTVKDIASDGHCLYRAVADQLLLHSQNSSSGSSRSPHTSAKSQPLDFVQLRKMAAHHMRSQSEEFAPFLGMDSGSLEYDLYCRKIEDVVGAEWGGQLEIRALSTELRRPIYVYDAEAPLLRMGTEFEDEASGLAPLRLAYHRHYLALGEHYNSVAPLSAAGDDSP